MRMPPERTRGSLKTRTGGQGCPSRQGDPRTPAPPHLHAGCRGALAHVAACSPPSLSTSFPCLGSDTRPSPVDVTDFPQEEKNAILFPRARHAVKFHAVSPLVMLFSFLGLRPVHLLRDLSPFGFLFPRSLGKPPPSSGAFHLPAAVHLAPCLQNKQAPLSFAKT